MPRRRRARDDVDWLRVGIGTLIGLGLAPGVVVGSYYLALWTGEDQWVTFGFLPLPVFFAVAVWLIGHDIWSRLIIGLLCALPAYFLVLWLGWTYACPLASINCSM